MAPRLLDNAREAGIDDSRRAAGLSHQKISNQFCHSFQILTDTRDCQPSNPKCSQNWSETLPMAGASVKADFIDQ
jgi:hypothetical protein